MPQRETPLLKFIPSENYLNLDQILHDIDLESQRLSDKKPTKPGNGFDNLGIVSGLLKGIQRLKFNNPTPIQKKGIPVGLTGDDLLAIAQTGSGKTLAFGIPMLQRLSKMNKGTGLVIVPTRELALQVEESLRALAQLVNIRMAVLIGGASMNLQRNALKKNPRIIVATPGRLMDHIEKKTFKPHYVEILILDEADRMLDMGFAPDIKKIMKLIPPRRQTMLFSATMPKEIEAIAGTLMNDPTRIEISRPGLTPSEVSHEMFVINNSDKSRLLAVKLKKISGPVLVFTRTKRMASRLKARVNKMGFVAAEIHSDRSQGQRQHALEGFKKGKYQILIATDIAARGIDVSGIELVVNYDMPANSEDYVHRIGRTGRAGKMGHAISFANTDQKGTIREIERFMKTKLAISAIPNLPSEKMLTREAKSAEPISKTKEDQKPSKPKVSKKRPSKRKNLQTSNPKNFASKRIESRQISAVDKLFDTNPQVNKTKKSDSTPRVSDKQKVAKSENTKKSKSTKRPFKSKGAGIGNFSKFISKRNESRPTKNNINKKNKKHSSKKSSSSRNSNGQK